jgi:hypothetical protein
MRRHFLLTALAALVAVGCSDFNDLPDPTVTNVVVDSVSLSALTGTPVAQPSAYSIPDNQAVRTDLTSGFDFAFDLDSTADGIQPVLVPLAALGLSTNSGVDPGLQRTDLAFDGITKAPGNGYTTDSAMVVDSGTVLFARSRVVCGVLGVPQYAKLEVTGVDPAQRTLTFRILSDNNCGYRGLEPGLPRE